MPESILINKAPLLSVDGCSLLADRESAPTILATINHHLTTGSLPAAKTRARFYLFSQADTIP
jgi:hypothetical protein